MGKRILVFLLFVFALIAVFYFFLARLSLDNYPVRGIDVSHHQGEIDWHKIKSQNISFAYIKATEGGDFKDPQFKKNWDHALEAGLRVGAYHFSGLKRTVCCRQKTLSVRCPNIKTCYLRQ
ncbi:lysozyme [Bartonella apihabitans]|uniref:Lysozyme n=1 Tax=Bartonella apihabitans TaxID=2750929 RepID=A0A1U9MDX1_9HYPH|nr:GH25 family lysozyme [Bartonella apihabitans]AQT43495.1 lysozyme [Bartonella apihabitans]